MEVSSIAGTPANANSSTDNREVFIPREDEAARFAENLVRQVREKTRPGQRVVLHFYHVQGEAPDPKLAEILEILSKEGVEFKGMLITHEDFVRRISEFKHGLPSPESVDRFILHYHKLLGDLAPNVQEQFRHLYDSENIYHRLKNFAKHVFGLPYGLTFFEHFVKTDESGESQRRFLPDSNITLQSVAITLGGIANLSFALFMNGMRPGNIHFILPNLVLAIWVPPFVYFQREVSAFRLQGRSVILNPTASPGDQIQVTDNKPLFTSLVVAQEWLLNLLLVPAIFGGYSWATLGNSLLNGFLGAYGSIFSEHWKGKLFLQAEAADKMGQHDVASRLASRAKWINLIWFMIVFPLLKNIEFITGPTHWFSLPFIALGTTFFIKETLLYGEGPISDRLRNNSARIVERIRAFFRGPEPSSGDIVIESVEPSSGTQ